MLDKAGQPAGAKHAPHFLDEFWAIGGSDVVQNADYSDHVEDAVVERNSKRVRLEADIQRRREFQHLARGVAAEGGAEVPAGQAEELAAVDRLS